jgi:hypothetical protein
MSDTPMQPPLNAAPAASGQSAPVHSAFLPLLLLGLSLAGWLGFQCWHLVNERQQLQQLAAGQEAPMNNANRMRASLDRLALSTRQLASEGNANARLLVDELQRRGVTINSEQAAVKPAPPAQ